MSKKINIPKMSDEKLSKLLERIKPVVRFAKIRTSRKELGDGRFSITMKPHPKGKLQVWDAGEPYYIKSVDPRKVSFIWSAKADKLAEGLNKIADITTYHTFGYHGFFKPSIAEVIEQIPKKFLGKVVAFEIVDSPKDVYDLNKHREALNQGFHVATTRLYF